MEKVLLSRDAATKLMAKLGLVCVCVKKGSKRHVETQSHDGHNGLHITDINAYNYSMKNSFLF